MAPLPLPVVVTTVAPVVPLGPADCAYLDDLGINLKPARALGMRTIKVVDPDAALAELAALTGVPLSTMRRMCVGRSYTGWILT